VPTAQFELIPKVIAATNGYSRPQRPSRGPIPAFKTYNEGPGESASPILPRAFQRNNLLRRTSSEFAVRQARSPNVASSTRTINTLASLIRIDNSEALNAWYTEAFIKLQQITCRLIAKLWIKKIHPKKVFHREGPPFQADADSSKQSTHPYNGQMRSGASPNPEWTKPPYWPRGMLRLLNSRLVLLST
jgi:hypothetical protein